MAETASEVRSQQELSRLLRHLRRREARRRGGRELTYREIAAKTGWSHAIIGQYLTGKVLPPTDRFDALVQILGALPGEQGALATARDRIEELRRRPAASSGPVPLDTSAPAAAPAAAAPAAALAAPMLAPAVAQPAAVTGSSAAEPGSVTPRQLPLAARYFTGRHAELAMLDHLAEQAAVGGGGVVIVMVDGMAGIGKTAFAVHAAHRVAHRFPDGQLYLNLRGFDPSGTPVQPAEAIRGFLDALAMPPARIPAGFGAQTSLYRSLLAGRRMLVLLDNARDVEQIRPLLPGSPGCLVMVTSRNRLTGLLLAEHAQPLTLDLLSSYDAYELLASRLGAGRMTADRKAADEIIDQCAGLPLALSIVAARAAAQPNFPLSLLAAELPHQGPHPRSPAGPRPADPETDLRAVFSWSYECLSDRAAQVFRLLGRSLGEDVSTPAAAALAGVDIASTRSAFAELAAAHLVIEPVPGRFTCHDLLRAYARQLSDRVDDESACAAARHRVHDYYLQTACQAARLLDPARAPITLAAPLSGVVPDTLTSCPQALAWFAAEHRILLACIDLAHRDQRHTYAWQLSWTLADYLDRRGHWHAWAATHLTALEAARRVPDRTGEAYAHRGIGRAFDRLGRYDDANHHLKQALGLYLDLGDRAGEAETRLNLAGLCERQGRYHESLESAQQALALFQGGRNRAGQANALNVIGWSYARLGSQEQALAYCQRALPLHEEAGDYRGAANTLDSLGYAYHNLGDHNAARASYQQALALFRDHGDRYYEAVTLTHIGDTECAAGNIRAARSAWTQALSILDPLDRADTDQVATRRDCPDVALVRGKLRGSC